MTTVIPQNELTKRAIAWVCEQQIDTGNPGARRKAIEEAARRFNLGPLEEEFLERFFKGDAANG
ncbi:MAG: hypothetical protein Q7I92_06370 [Humidesulfovibrio sp.]|jgi:hypothetical protein|nr:hypothetical protein [Humidesulfovibrio sp.]PKN06827.1 MAG: hypothetical protein CVU73_14995 [Deltaproteobacteria bacterium HGW-Deltaproteobacteria-8]